MTPRTTIHHPSRSRWTVLIVVAICALVLSACGSRIDPNDVAGGTAGGPGGVVTGDGGVVVDPATGEVIDPGTGTVDPGTGTVDPGTGTVDPGTGEGGGSTPEGGGGGGTPPGGGVKAADCDGFKNQTGITDTEILIGNASDISGPVPGLFEASQDAVKAYVAAFNKSSDICGRKLKLVTYDSRTDAAADQQAYTKACGEVFAMVGSMSAFDSGGAPTAQGCGLPDIRSAAVTNERNSCTTCFGAQSTFTGEVQNAVPDFVIKNYGASAQKAGFLYINAGASVQNATKQASGWGKRGMKFLVVEGIDISEFNYAPYVQRLADEGVEVVFWTGAYQQSIKLRQAMQQQGYEPKLYLRDPTDYNPSYVKDGGSAVDGTVIFTNFTPFEEANSNPETAKYMSWLQQVRPGTAPTFFGVFSWSAAELFVQKALALGGGLNRQSLIAAVKNTKSWTGNGITAPQYVGPKRTGDCWRFIQLKGSTWVPVGGTKYDCAGTTNG
jgi:ABC-type branched-subunit amino acid transport system substrate-binding protein